LLGKTVKQLLAELDSEELSEWMAYSRIEPLPDPWLQTGVLASVTFNSWHKRPRAPQDFVPGRRTRRRQTPEQMMAVLDRMERRLERRGRGGG